VIRNHPLLPRDVPVHGLMMDSESGGLKPIVDGYAIV
jgi:carbonic anhydrase